ncbi:uncharacterized protein [Henckelia pumila]|uniref:uncharacterized protein n=1 Tax=Henckelia pumila TaxID=405737 RepID=UPI003C6E1A52
MEVFHSLGQKCSDINPQLTTLQFIAPHEKISVTLNDDDDVRNMINLHMCLKLSIIHLKASRKIDQSRGSRNVIGKCNLIHCCGEDNLKSRGHPNADSPWVANLVKAKLRGESSYRPCTMVKDIQRDYGVELDYHKVWMGKEIAMHDIHGTENGSYDKLRCGCRPLLFLDGCHIKNKYKGSLLVAVAKDANDDLFTLAYAVVDAENDSNWDWFCYRLKEVLASQGIIFFHGFTFFSDRHSGLIKAIHSMFPGSHHAYCLRHIVDNFVKLVLRKYPFRNKRHWSSVLKKAAYAPSRHEFDEHINQITESMPLAIEFIVNSSPENWANALFLGKRWGIINNNMAESWKNWVKVARYLPIVSLVDHIRI